MYCFSTEDARLSVYAIILTSVFNICVVEIQTYIIGSFSTCTNPIFTIHLLQTYILLND